MSSQKDFYNDQIAVPLLCDDLSATTNSLYVDTSSYKDVWFTVTMNMTTASTGNSFTASLYGYNGATPTTASGYTQITSYNGSFAANDSTGLTSEWVAPYDRLYRYYYIKITEASTAEGDVCVTAHLQNRHQPSAADTVTTGTPS